MRFPPSTSCTLTEGRSMLSAKSLRGANMGAACRISAQTVPCLIHNKNDETAYKHLAYYKLTGSTAWFLARRTATLRCVRRETRRVFCQRRKRTSLCLERIKIGNRERSSVSLGSCLLVHRGRRTRPVNRDAPILSMPHFWLTGNRYNFG